MKLASILLLAGLAASVTTTSSAVIYDFDVAYLGGGAAALQAGSDDPLTSSLVVGDSFVYELTAPTGMEWLVNDTDTYMFLGALGVQEGGVRIGDLALELFQGGTSVYSLSESSQYQANVHMGPTENTLSSGLRFDTLVASYDLLAFTPNDGLATTSTPNSLLPLLGAPDNHSGISLVTAIPEPSTYAAILAALAGLGTIVLRRRARS